MAQMKVTGTVVSSEDGEPLYGVTVKVVGTGTGTTTDFNGAFNIEVKEKAVLEFSYIGMLPIKKTASPKMQIVMDPDQQNLDEVMVVAFIQQDLQPRLTKGNTTLKLVKSHSMKPYILTLKVRYPSS